MAHALPPGPPADDRPFRLFATRCLLRDRAPEPWRLVDLARHAGMSPFHFLRLFRATFGTTPHRLAMEFRLARAKELLAGTDLPVTAICFECGYESLGSFSHLFRRATGCSPRDYRRRHRRRSWSIAFPPWTAFAPFCLLDVFRGDTAETQFPRSISPAASVSLVTNQPA